MKRQEGLTYLLPRFVDETTQNTFSKQTIDNLILILAPYRARIN